MNAFRAQDEFISRVSCATVVVFAFYVFLAMISARARRRREKQATADSSRIAPARRHGFIASVGGVLRVILEPLAEFVAGCSRALHPEDLVAFVKSEDVPAASLMKFSLGTMIVNTILIIYVYQGGSALSITGYPVVDDFLIVLPAILVFSTIALVDCPGIRILGGRAPLIQTLVASCYTSFAFVPMMFATNLAFHAFETIQGESKIPTQQNPFQGVFIHFIGLAIWGYQINSLALLHNISEGKIFVARTLGYGALIGAIYLIIQQIKIH